MPTIHVRAQANVYGLRRDQTADVEVNGEVEALIANGLLSVEDDQPVVPRTAPPDEPAPDEPPPDKAAPRRAKRQPASDG